MLDNEAHHFSTIFSTLPSHTHAHLVSPRPAFFCVFFRRRPLPFDRESCASRRDQSRWLDHKCCHLSLPTCPNSNKYEQTWPQMHTFRSTNMLFTIDVKSHRVSERRASLRPHRWRMCSTARPRHEPGNLHRPMAIHSRLYALKKTMSPLQRHLPLPGAVDIHSLKSSRQFVRFAWPEQA